MATEGNNLDAPVVIPPIQSSTPLKPASTLDQDLELARIAAEEAFREHPYKLPKEQHIPPAKIHPEKGPNIFARHFLGGRREKPQAVAIKKTLGTPKYDPLKLPNGGISHSEFKKRLEGPRGVIPTLTLSREPTAK
jgi:hypothetical protein